MAEQPKKPQAPQKPAVAPKPAAPKPAVPKPGTPTSGCCGAPASKPASPQTGQK
jgi:hypothetical protein